MSNIIEVSSESPKFAFDYEALARRLCKIRRIDPDETVFGVPCPDGRDGRNGREECTVAHCGPRWRKVLHEVQDFADMLEVFGLALRDER